MCHCHLAIGELGVAQRTAVKLSTTLSSRRLVERQRSRALDCVPKFLITVVIVCCTLISRHLQT